MRDPAGSPDRPWLGGRGQQCGGAGCAAVARGSGSVRPHRTRARAGRRLAVIRIDGVRERLRASERFGLDTLIDLSRSLVADSADCDLVRLIVTEEQGRGELVADLAPGGLQRGEGAIHVGTATLRAIAEVAGGAVEQRSKLRDKNGRGPGSEDPPVFGGRG